jgi:hypothetical protein
MVTAPRWIPILPPNTFTRRQSFFVKRYQGALVRGLLARDRGRRATRKPEDALRRSGARAEAHDGRVRQRVILFVMETFTGGLTADA